MFQCPPCKTITPKLLETYEKLVCDAEVDGTAGVEVVFVSSDRSASSFDDYYGNMPWLAVPYEDTERAEQLRRYCQIQGDTIDGGRGGCLK